MKTIVLPMVIVVGLVGLVSGSASQAASGRRIGSSKAVVDHAWQRDRVRCTGGICTYKTWYQKWLYIAVGFASNRADGFTVEFDPDRYLGHSPNPSSSAYWRFLVGLLPSGARKQSCRNFARTGNDAGPAYACVYAYRGNTILVVHYLTEPRGDLQLGMVNLGDDFDTITPAG